MGSYVKYMHKTYRGSKNLTPENLIYFIISYQWIAGTGNPLAVLYYNTALT